MTAAQRKAAETAMKRRDRLERRGGRGTRASRRTRYPGFLESDDMEDEDMEDGGLLSQMKRRTRRQYDERRDMDDLDGVEDVSIG
jgi:DNA replication licensing factor MCM2